MVRQDMTREAHVYHSIVPVAWSVVDDDSSSIGESDDGYQLVPQDQRQIREEFERQDAPSSSSSVPKLTVRPTPILHQPAGHEQVEWKVLRKGAERSQPLRSEAKPWKSAPVKAEDPAPLLAIMSQEEEEHKSDPFSPDMPLKFVIRLDGMWGQNSAKVHSDCPLAHLKKAFVPAFLNGEPVDRQNATPHINVKGKDDIYNKLNGTPMALTLDDLVIKQDCIEINLGSGCHFTVVYQRGLARPSQNQQQKLALREKIKKTWISVLKRIHARGAVGMPGVGGMRAPPAAEVSAAVPNATASSSSSNSSAPPPQAKVNPNSLRVDSITVKVPLQLNGWWGKDSCYVHADCPLAKLKSAFLNALVPTPHDRRNLTPHINLRGSREQYAQLDGSTLELSLNDIRVNDNFLEIDLGSGAHFTLAYDRGVGRLARQESALLQAIWQLVMVEGKPVLSSSAAAASPGPGHIGLSSSSSSSGPSSVSFVHQNSIPIPERFIWDRPAVWSRLILNEWWGRDSCLVSEECVLSKLKHALTNLLVPQPHDRRNRTPHINLHGNRAHYARLDGSPIELRPGLLTVKPDSIEYDVEGGAHFTLAYDRGIGRIALAKQKEIEQLWRSVVEDSALGAREQTTIHEEAIERRAGVPFVPERVAPAPREWNRERHGVGGDVRNDRLPVERPPRERREDRAAAAPGVEVNPDDNTRVRVTLQLEGWWNNGCARVRNESELAQLRDAFIKEFMPNVTPEDAPLSPPQVFLSEERYQELDGMQVEFGIDDLVIGTDSISILIDIGAVGVRATKFTLLHVQGIGGRVRTPAMQSKIRAIWQKVFGVQLRRRLAPRDMAAEIGPRPAELLQPRRAPRPSDEQFNPASANRMVHATARKGAFVAADPSALDAVHPSKVLPNGALECVVCLTAARNCIIDCVHYSMCIGCAKKVLCCPICRQIITIRMEKLIIVS